jgi:hypothetical protein|tara:strand:- start:448 stop:1788 length:1341 start_codon:yes stop_codon:yes gene_type:complete
MKLNNKIKNKESQWFEKNTSNYQEVYIPIEIAKNLELRHYDKIAVEIVDKNSKYIFPARVRYRVKKDGNCFRFQIPKDSQEFLSRKVLVKVTKLEKPSKIILRKNEIDVSKACSDSSNIAAWIDGDSIVLWDNMKYPLIVSRVVNALDFAKYLGLYYADGGKSNHYNCNSSTKEIAKLVLNCYHNFIKNSRYTTFIAYRKLNGELDKDVSRRIKKHWFKLTKISSSNIKLTGYKKTFKSSTKYGIFRIDDSRLLALNLHKWLIKETLKLGNDNHKILEEFLKGGLIGDGGVSNRRKEAFQHIKIASNSKEYKVWESICRRLGLKYDIKKEEKTDGVYVRFREYYESVQLYKNGIFNEYTKRRNKLLIGLRNSVETYIAKQFLKSNFQPIPIKGKFGSRTPSFFYVNKGGDLVKNNLIFVNNKTVTITDKGKNFVKDLINLEILEDD